MRNNEITVIYQASAISFTCARTGPSAAVTDAGDEATLKMCEELKALGIRATADTRNEKLGFKVRRRNFT